MLESTPKTDAFDAVYEKHKPGILRFALGKAQSNEDAEDAVSHAFVQYATQIRSSIITDPQAWLRTIVVRKLIDIFRKKSHLGKRISMDEGLAFQSSTAPSSALAEEQADLLLGSLQELSDQQQKILHLRFWEGQKSNDIAELHNTTSSNVDVCICRAKKRIRELLTVRHPDYFSDEEASA